MEDGMSLSAPDGFKEYLMPSVTSTAVYPIDCVYTSDELSTIDQYKTDFENTVSEQAKLAERGRAER